MILEHAWLPVSPGREDEFAAAITAALPVIESAPGCLGAEVRHQVEDPTIFLLTVRWESLDAHMAFRASELFQTWKGLTHIFYREAPTVTHFTDPLAR